ncbi:O-antigen ligase family protein [Chelativorans sp. Marseille-P2723]|uniref:O-antigen ligase family protein n=1 Tax=Chelativorans sp. Marseille-P2723 TaxID=2709133 RepID=UPI001570B1BF|nr:O-antigen ligase family protein [Chelativorans sp. Marseille-P2723]
MLRFLLWRRHYDPLLLAAAMACLVSKIRADIVIFGFFLTVGLYLIAVRHRSLRYIDPVYATGSCLYGIGAIVLGVAHWNFPDEIRWIGYPVYLMLGIAFFPSVTLVKDPLRQIVLGSRVGLALAVFIGVLEVLAGGERMGLGGNAANTAFVIAVAGVLARMQVPSPPRLLPNSRLWFYLAAFAVIMTGTRSVLPIFLLGLLFDIFAFRRQLLDGILRFPLKGLAAFGIVLAMGFTAIGYELSSSIANRFEYTLTEFDSALHFNEGRQDQELTGLSIRLVLWQQALDVISHYPILGSGGESSMEEIQLGIPPDQRPIFAHYIHVHNFILDELRIRGSLGLALMLGFFVAVSWKLWASGLPEIRQALVLFLVSLTTYGSLHGVLLADRNIALIAIFLTMMLLHLQKVEFWGRVRKAS